MLSIAGICAVVAVVFLTSAIVAHGCSTSDPCSNYDTYSYGSAYQYPPSQMIVSPLSATCYSQPISTFVGTSVQWTASVTGGVFPYSYNITWIGDEGLSGYGSSISKVYSTPGSKTASIQVISGGQTTAVNCSNSINVMLRTTADGFSFGNYNYGSAGNNNYQNNSNYNGYSNYNNNGYSNYNNYNSNNNGYSNYNNSNYNGYNSNNGYNSYNGYGNNYNQYSGYNGGYQNNYNGGGSYFPSVYRYR